MQFWHVLIGAATVCLTLTYSLRLAFHTTILCQINQTEGYSYLEDDTIRQWTLQSVAIGLALGLVPLHFAHVLGTRAVVTAYGLLGGIVSLFYPLAHENGFLSAFVVRTMQGVPLAVLLWTVARVSAEWAPREGMASAIAALSSVYQLAPLVAQVTAAEMCSTLGWEYTYYLLGSLTLVAHLFFFSLYSNNAQDSRFVSEEEKAFIKQGKAGPPIDEGHVPYSEIVGDRTVCATWIANFAYFASLLIFLQWGPIYCKQVLGFSVRVTGHTGGLAHVLCLGLKMLVATILDRSQVDTTKKLKWALVAVETPAVLCLLAIGFVSDPVARLALCTLFIVFHGTAVIVIVKAQAFRAGRHNHVLANGNTLAIVVCLLLQPMIVGRLVPDNSSEQWSTMFLGQAVVVTASVVVFTQFVDARSAKHAMLHDVDVVCFEASGDIGGLWSYKAHETDESSVMKSTVINTSKEMTAYSDFPPEAGMANFMHNTELLRYFRSYATKFDLLSKIKFHHKVKSIRRVADYANSGRWRVTYTNEKHETLEETFGGVLLCSGHHTKPYWPPDYVDQYIFRGKISHSHSYKDHRGYEDKVVVVVGIGNSGGDIAVELSRIAKKVYLVTRRGTWIFNRIFEYGQPIDMVLNRKIWSDLRDFVPESLANWFVERKLNHRFDHNRYGLKPRHRVFGAHPTVNDELPNRIACGTVVLKPNIAKFKEDGVMFEDGSLATHVDEVIMSTGFSFDFGLVEDGNLIPVADNEVSLYKYMFPVVTSDHNTLAIIGLVQPYGSIMPLSEMQARVFLQSFTGSIHLPRRAQMLEENKTVKDALQSRYVASRRHTIQVDYVPYIEELAELIGCQLKMAELWKSDPLLAYHAYFGPRVPYIYRLQGPHAWSGARQAIFDVDDRVLLATGGSLDLNVVGPLPLYAMIVVLFLVGLFFACI